MEFFFSISLFQIFMIIFIFSKSVERNKTHIYSNNINILSGYNLRYVNFASNSDGDMIFYSTSYPDSPLRAFYGLKNNGRPFFKNEKYSDFIKSDKSPQNKFESKILFIKINNYCEEEYLISVGKADSYVEIYDFGNNIAYYRLIDVFSELNPNPILSLRNEAIILDKNTSGNYYLFGFTFKKYFNEDTYFPKFILKYIILILYYLNLVK